MTQTHVDAVVVTFNSAGHIRPCLGSLRKSGANVVVVDSCSDDDTVEIIRREYPEARVIALGKNSGYGAAVNLGVAACTADVVLIANSDTVFPDGALASLTQFLDNHPRIGVVGPQQIFPDGSWQRSGGGVSGIREAAAALFGLISVAQFVSRRWSWTRRTTPKPVGYVDGAVMVMRRRAFEEVGGFDASFYYYSEDADLCERLRRANWGVFTLPSVKVVHIRGGSSTKIEGRSERLLKMQADAAYHLVRKYHSRAYSILYSILCAFHGWKMFVIYKILQTVTQKSRSAHMGASAGVFLQWARIWGAKRD